ncbi:hypothetical protein B7494_g942 [Chlorociboria aeruginascens]|nr:hypothetical protein B7494_g942 [Chlorociboria aeruginascens]
MADIFFDVLEDIASVANEFAGEVVNALDGIDRAISAVGNTLLDELSSNLITSLGQISEGPNKETRLKRRKRITQGPSRVGSFSNDNPFIHIAPGLPYVPNDNLIPALIKVAQYCQQQNRQIKIVACHGIEDDLLRGYRGHTYEIFYFGDQQLRQGHRSDEMVFQTGLEYAAEYFKKEGIRFKSSLIRSQVEGFMEYAGRFLHHVDHPQRRVLFQHAGLEIIAPPMDFKLHWSIKNFMMNSNNKDSVAFVGLELLGLNMIFSVLRNKLGPSSPYYWAVALKEAPCPPAIAVPYNFEWKYRPNCDFCITPPQVHPERAMVTYHYLQRGFQGYFRKSLTINMAQIMNSRFYASLDHIIAFPPSEPPASTSQASSAFQPLGNITNPQQLQIQYPNPQDQQLTRWTTISSQPQPSAAAAAYTPTSSNNRPTGSSGSGSRGGGGQFGGSSSTRGEDRGQERGERS